FHPSPHPVGGRGCHLERTRLPSGGRAVGDASPGGGRSGWISRRLDRSAGRLPRPMEVGPGSPPLIWSEPFGRSQIGSPAPTVPARVCAIAAGCLRLI